jgi:hypothetical protein
MKPQTLEEVAEMYANKKGDIPTTELEDAIFKQGFKDGAQRQANRMYSEEEVNNLLYRFLEHIGEKQKRTILNVVPNEWFDRNKKK